MDTLLTILNYSAIALAGYAVTQNLQEAKEMRSVKESILDCDCY